ncbi:mannose-1-phosphate guanylyltransferase/mannose-6-phosphate isomerase [Salinisphaera sp. Q1T1-3]|uniref:mannose-1-phosphate guanylyltransferase/mannose-6-phosphate isomerase n=1 Tax=Salinisphaera sp. Q1T1-3 TaxID=2321229 RepID=UPI000E72F807|nr:mannose-1-phosphate guanylyltransferase/mannose-6-phosphate isomerase [Salinisphaera sp. Q1T1-3]RJS92543.1 mannose-1-phosphate guanylyltransferase/mannose-6-phosphate isomerase [Salinisphaera sp. Q1T1-3]
MRIPVLLAGGLGTRLWPSSRRSRPKQFLPLADDEASLFSQSLTRLGEIDDLGPAIVIGHDEHRFVIAEQMRAAGHEGRILLEPAARNTAAAVAAAALEARHLHGSQVELLVLPTDHAIADTAALRHAIAQARGAVADGALALFGVVPERAETAYGYIHAGDEIAEGVRRVDGFVEKPDPVRAAHFLAAGDYFWNSGMFVFRAADYLALLSAYAPDIHDGVQAAYKNAVRDIDFLRLESVAFSAVRADSIDYAVMERTDRAVMVTLATAWSDLAGWSAVARANGADARGNTVMGDVWLADSDDCLVRSEDQLVAVLGMRGAIIVETPDAVLVADRSREQDIGRLVADLDAAGRSEAIEHRKAYRPWGSYRQIATGPRYQVKHIRVSPGGRLSLQSHHHRAEHWVVVRGTARVTRDDDVVLLTENQSTYLPLGSVHRLENPGKVDLDLIEVQSGSYLGEDDIVRYDDVYGRTPPPDTDS